MVFLSYHLPKVFFSYNIIQRQIHFIDSCYKCEVHFITLFNFFKYRIFTFFLFVTYPYQIFYKYNSSVSRSFSPRHLNILLRKLIYQSIIFNNFKNFLTILNSSVNYNLVLVTILTSMLLAIPECILIFYTEVITVLVKLKNVFLIVSINRSYRQSLCYWQFLAHLISVDKFIGYLQSVCPPLQVPINFQFS